jgi:hypothetical protein
MTVKASASSVRCPPMPRAAILAFSSFVTTTASSAAAIPRTSSSEMPGCGSATYETSWPSARRASTIGHSTPSSHTSLEKPTSDRVDDACFQGLGCKRHRCQHSLTRQTSVGSYDGLYRLSCSESFDDALHGNASTTDDRLAHHDLAVRYDHLMHRASSGQRLSPIGLTDSPYTARLVSAHATNQERLSRRSPGGHLKVPHPRPGQNPPPSNRPWHLRKGTSRRTSSAAPDLTHELEGRLRVGRRRRPQPKTALLSDVAWRPWVPWPRSVSFARSHQLVRNDQGW